MALNIFEIPLPARPTTFIISLGGTSYTWRLYWLVPMQCWVVDIADGDGNALINGIPLVPDANLLGQWGYVGLDGVLFVRVDHDPDAVPDFTHLGITGHLYWISA